jgi:hypothetical protein
MARHRAEPILEENENEDEVNLTGDENSLEELENKPETEEQEPKSEEELEPVKTEKIEVPQQVQQQQQSPQPINLKIDVSQPKRSPGRPRKSEEVDKEIQNQYEEVDEIIRNIDPGSTTGAYVILYRHKPEKFNGKDLEGYVGKFDEVFTIEDIKQKFGGGVYDLRIYVPQVRADGKQHGVKQYWSKRVKVAGDPIIQGNNQSQQSNDSNTNPDIAKLAFNQSVELMKSMKEDKDNAIRKADAAQNRPNDNEQTKLLVSMMDKQIEISRMQLEAAKEEAKIAREEARQLSKEKDQSAKVLLEESAKASQNQIQPLIAMMMQQSAENMKRMEQQSQENQKRMEMMIETMRETSKNEADRNQKFSETQMKIMQDSGKMQVELLTGELKRTSEQLSNIQKSNSGTLIDKLKEFKLLKGLLSDESAGEPGSITDRIMDNLPQIADSIPGIITSITNLIKPGVPIPLPARAVATPPAQIARPLNNQQNGQQNNQQNNQPANQSEDKIKEMDLMLKANKLKKDGEVSITNGSDPVKFSDDNIIGTFDDELLIKITSVPFETLYSTLKQQLVGEDTPLMSMNGKEFMSKVYEHVKEEMQKE